jgi:O-Antigen ligase
MTPGMLSVPHGAPPPEERVPSSVPTWSHAAHESTQTGSWLGLIAMILAHVPLAILMREFPWLAVVHAVLVITLGLFWAARGDVERVAYVAAYLASVDVLWRMTAGNLIFYEGGHFGIIALLLLSLLRSKSLPPLSLLIYGVLLVPSIVMVMAGSDIWKMRSDLSFNLSGPFCLLVCSWFFSRLALNRGEVERLLLVLEAPIAGISALALFGIATTSEIRFANGSNFAASGGFGPNQVSTLLGLGSLVALLLAIFKRRGGLATPILLLSVAVLSSQSALTFSRSGLYCAIGGAVAGAVASSRNARARFRLTLVAVVFSGLAYVAVIPYLDAFTEGRLTERFSNTRLSGRDQLVMKELNLFIRNPLLGVGVGGSKTVRAMESANNPEVANHSEFTRLLAEHGMLGLVALLILLWQAARNVGRQSPGFGRTLTCSLLIWSLLIMAINAMRSAAPAFAFGLGFALFSSESAQDEHGLPEAVA